jgi:CubicO group peptidase (beta-lactamase class C family)
MKRALLLATALATLPAAAGQPAISNAAAVRAIIGEAGNQSDDAMLAVASALRNRETLQGVYGVNNPVIPHASAELRARV